MFLYKTDQLCLKMAKIVNIIDNIWIMDWARLKFMGLFRDILVKDFFRDFGSSLAIY